MDVVLKGPRRHNGFRLRRIDDFAELNVIVIGVTFFVASAHEVCLVVYIFTNFDRAHFSILTPNSPSS